MGDPCGDPGPRARQDPVLVSTGSQDPAGHLVHSGDSRGAIEPGAGPDAGPRPWKPRPPGAAAGCWLQTSSEMSQCPRCSGLLCQAGAGPGPPGYEARPINLARLGAPVKPAGVSRGHMGVRAGACDGGRSLTACGDALRPHRLPSLPRGGPAKGG